MSFEIERDETSANEYPYYGEYDSTIVLFIGVDSGMIIASKNNHKKIGYFSKYFDEYKYKKLNVGDRIIIDIDE